MRDVHVFADAKNPRTANSSTQRNSLCHREFIYKKEINRFCLSVESIERKCTYVHVHFLCEEKLIGVTEKINVHGHVFIFNDRWSNQGCPTFRDQGAPSGALETFKEPHL